MFKPWKDGLVENSLKIGGVYMAFLLVSGLFGADYHPTKTNPFVWGWVVRATANHAIDSVTGIFDR